LRKDNLASLYGVVNIQGTHVPSNQDVFLLFLLSMQQVDINTFSVEQVAKRT